MAVIFHLPEGPSGKPVVVVAIEDHRGVVVYAGTAQEAFHLFFADDITAKGLLKLIVPIPGHGSRHMALFVGGGVNIHLNQTNVGVASVFGDPLGGGQ